MPPKRVQPQSYNAAAANSDNSSAADTTDNNSSNTVESDNTEQSNTIDYDDYENDPIEQFKLERRGVRVIVGPNESADDAMNRLDRLGRSANLHFDDLMKSPLMGSTLRHQVRSQQKQKIERVNRQHHRSRLLMFTLRSLLYMRNRGAIRPM